MNEIDFGGPHGKPEGIVFPEDYWETHPGIERADRGILWREMGARVIQMIDLMVRKEGPITSNGKSMKKRKIIVRPVICNFLGTFAGVEFVEFVKKALNGKYKDWEIILEAPKVEQLYNDKGDPMPDVLIKPGGFIGCAEGAVGSIVRIKLNN